MKKSYLSFLIGFLLISCSDESKPPFQFEKELIQGEALSFTTDNLNGKWRVHKLYSEYNDLSEINPSLSSGFLELKLEKDSCYYSLNQTIGMPVYGGKVNQDSLSEGILKLAMMSGTTKLPVVRFKINKVTSTQLDVDWEYYDPSKGSPGATVPLVVYKFNNGSLAPDSIFREGLVASNVSFGSAISVHANAGDTALSVSGWLNNINSPRTKNIWFKLSSPDYTIAVDSLYFKGFRLPATLANSRVQFSTSAIGVEDLVNNGPFYDLPKDGSSHAFKLGVSRNAAGENLFIGLTANITQTGTLYIDEIRIFGKFTRGDRYFYSYIFNR